MGLGYFPSAFVHTDAMLVLNKNRYDYKFSDKNNNYSGVIFYLKKSKNTEAASIVPAMEGW